MKPLVVGITGCSGSGKTYLLRKLAEHIDPSRMALLSMDNYYKPIEQQIRDEHNVVNFDLPESIDEAKLESDLRLLTEGKVVRQKEYTFNVHDGEPTILEIHPADIIIVEGIFTMHYKGVKAMIDLEIFMDSSEETMLQRRIERDERERGYHDRSVRYRFENHVLPAFHSFVLPYRKEADILIDNEGNFEVGFNKIIDELKRHLGS